MSLTNDLMLTILFLLVLLCLVLPLLVMLARANQSNRETLLTLLAHQTSENQSLRNQLRAGDPLTLHHLQEATNQKSTSNEQQPLNDYEAYQQALASQGLTLGDIDDDLSAAGWEQPVFPNDGGNPVQFERP